MTGKRLTGKRPTLKDVAARAGLSTIVASNTFTRPERVSEASRARILAAAEELGYRPNHAARALRSGRTWQLGVVVSEHLGYAFRDPSAVRFLAGVADACAEGDSGMLLLPTGGNRAGAEVVEGAGVDGFVFWTTTADDPALISAVRSGLPVAVQGGPAVAGAITVAIDDQSAARAIAEYVIKHVGVQRLRGGELLVVSFPTHRHRSTYMTSMADVDADLPVTRARLAGIREAVMAVGVGPGEIACQVVAVNERELAERCVAERVSGGAVPRAILCLSDELALGAWAACQQVGSMPIITGFDATAEATAHGVITIDQDLEAQGRLCARIALGQASTGGSQPWRLVVPGQL